MGEINISPEILRIKDEVVQNRRYLHKHPELAYQEFNTAKFIENRLIEMGLKPKTGIAKTGIICDFLIGAQQTILLRADIDGLPVEEKNNVSYASSNKGIMHACGHDGHIAMLLGVARLLEDWKDKLKVNIRMMFQPAEEGPGGALAMIEEGVLENPKVDYAFALHLWNELNVGEIGLKEGYVMACGDRFDLEIIGKGGHGAAPHLSNDPVIVLAHIINAYQTVVSRLYSPFEPLALSFGTLSGGYAFNVIPDKIRVSGTFRTFSPAIRSQIESKLANIAQSIGKAWGVEVKFQYHKYYPPTINDGKVVAHLKRILQEVFPQANIKYNQMTMGAEDFSYILERVPGAYIFIGSKNSEKGFASPHHSPTFDFDEDALLIGIEVFKNIIFNAHILSSG
ncbi:MAG: M20 family metallopeptidase [Planctomycetota bacterium]